MMSDTDRIIIKDSCVLFDLIDLDLLSDFFSLELQIHTTIHVISEVTEEHQLQEVNRFINSGDLLVDGNGTYEVIQEIYEECSGLSFTDCSVLEFAMRTDGLVLSSDKSLRKEILKRKFNVRGLLWVINELCDRDILSIDLSIYKLKEYSKINNRAPKLEISRLIEKLENKKNSSKV